MNRIYYFILSAVILGFASCDKDSPGDDYDFSNTVSPYITISKAPATAAPGGTASFTLTIRTAISRPLVVTYSVAGGVNLPNQTVTMDRFTLTKAVEVTIPEDAEAPSQATVTLLGATSEDGMEFTVGRFDPATETMTINIAE